MSDPRRTLVALLSALTAVALAASGEATVLGFAVPAAIPLGAWLWRGGRRPGWVFNRIFDLATVAGVLWFLTAFWRNLVGASVALTMLVQVYYLLRPSDGRSLSGLQLLGTCQLVALTATTTRIFFLPVLVAWLLLAPAVFTLRALEVARPGSRRPVPLPPGFLRACVPVIAACFAGTALGFVLVPRYEAGLMQRFADANTRVSGFSDDVELGDIGRILVSDAIAMRVRVEGRPPERLLWRGVVLDEFSGRAWSSSGGTGAVVRGSRMDRLAEPPPGSRRFVQEYRVEPMQSRAIFHVAPATGILPFDFAGVRLDEHGALRRWDPMNRAISYRIVSHVEGRVVPEPLEPELRAACLQLPPLDPRVEQLAADLVAGLPSDAEKAARIQHHLRTQHGYSLDVQDSGVEDPIGRFLLERRPAHCEYFSSGMVVLLRSQGIPARLVNGFREGTWSGVWKTWIVRQRDAHSWVEAWLPDSGWTTFDPTPIGPAAPAPGLRERVQEAWRAIQIAWDDNVIGFNISHQLGFLVGAGEWRDAALARLRGLGVVAPAIGGAALAAAGAATWLVLRRRRAVVPRFLREALRLLERRGHRRRPGQTPLELAREVADSDPEVGGVAETLVRLYNAQRFGGSPVVAAEVAPLLARLRALTARG